MPLKEVVRDASVLGTNWGAFFAGRLVLTRVGCFTESRRTGGTYLDDMIYTIL
jgi:hypothetical protein